MKKTKLISQSYLMTCPDGTHLMEVARIHARDFNPADVFWLAPIDDAKSIQVEQTQEWSQRVHFGAVGDRKLFIITDTSIMTPAAQNKILKTIEEPRPNTVFLLLATDPSRVLSTIKSRCIQIQIPPPPPTPPSQEALDAANALIRCKTLDEMLPHIPLITLPALTIASGNNYNLLKILSDIQRNIQANANPTNALDLFIIQLLKQNYINTP
ncbi:MAG: hypothetical protein FWE31_02935 [Firmicutes bacterium]|nr:hypothetical protein [Bacillota bacterium]